MITKMPDFVFRVSFGINCFYFKYVCKNTSIISSKRIIVYIFFVILFGVMPWRLTSL